MPCNNYFTQLGRNEKIKKNKELALQYLESIPQDDEFDRLKQEIVLRLIDDQLDGKDDFVVNPAVMEEEYIKWNYIADDDEDKTKAKKDFADVITFFVASGLIEIISFADNKFYVDQEQYERARRSIFGTQYKMGKRK